MAEVKANLQHLLEIAKRVDPCDAEAISNAMAEIERGRQQGKDLNQYGKWYAWLHERILIKPEWSDDKHTYLSIRERGGPYVLGAFGKHLDTKDVDTWVKDAIKAEKKVEKGTKNGKK
ncbi:hypothetical protein V0M98_34150 (plasmid) [Pseudomonas silesiensis]|uniref:hypothetical protein n=1 Tax=Pseudomonas silesiensis TaxID=1853130 RepID=UPI0030CF8988